MTTKSSQKETEAHSPMAAPSALTPEMIRAITETVKIAMGELVTQQREASRKTEGLPPNKDSVQGIAVQPGQTMQNVSISEIRSFFKRVELRAMNRYKNRQNGGIQVDSMKISQGA